jgi:filamentous hemagglutinin family protein
VKIAASTAGTQPITDFSSLTVNNPNYTAVGSVGNIIVGGANLILDHVVGGDSAATVSIGKTTTVTQKEDKAIIDWMRFSLGADESLTFNQPNSSSIILNRVTTDLPSVIAGTLRANGRVFILNSNGVLFTANSHVNVGALVASTFNLKDDDFLKSNYVFTVAQGSGSIISEGDIVIAENGFVALAGNHDVKHTGTINGGDAALFASTDSLTLNLEGRAVSPRPPLYAIGNLAGTTTVGGRVNIGSATKGGELLTAGDTVTANGMNLSTGTSGAWDWRQNGDIAIGAGQFAGSFVNDNLNTRSLSLRSREGDITVNGAIDWSANTTLTLDAGRDININKSIKATGASAGLVMDYGGDYYLITPATFSGAVLDATGKPVARQIPAGTEYSSITLSGANAKLRMNGNDYTLIHSMDGFAAIDDATGTATGYFALAQDLDASAWSAAHLGTPSVVRQFSGTFAGLGHKVDNLKLNATASDGPMGLIGITPKNDSQPTVIRDIGVTNVDVARTRLESVLGVGQVAGALVGGSDGKLIIRQAYTTGKIVVNDSAGGLIGAADNSGVETYIDRSFSDVTLKTTGGDLADDLGLGGGYFGGLVGRADTVTITNSHATGNITAEQNRFDENGRWVETRTGNDVGGLLGRGYWVDVDSSYATGNVTAYGANSVGGLIGTVNTILVNTRPQGFVNKVTNSFATGNVIGGMAVGGLIGSIHADGTEGMVTVDNAYATGNVTGTLGQGSYSWNGGQLGGLIGSAEYAAISNSHATGDVNTIAQNISSYMGGLVGSQRNGSISDSYATGNVIGNGGRGVGGLVGSGSGTISDSYYVNEKVENSAQNNAEMALARSELSDILQQNKDAAQNKDVAKSKPDNTLTALDQYIYQDNGEGYSARVKAVSVEETECAENDENCKENK